MKVVRNFACNGVKKTAGDTLSKEECDKIGEEFGKKLLADDYLRKDNEKKEPKPEMKPEIKPESRPEPNQKDLSSIPKEEMLEYAKELGLSPHHKTGEAKLRKTLEKYLSNE